MGGDPRSGVSAGMVSVDVRVEGCYYPGEKDLLQALRSVGFETCFAALRSGGIQVVDDLVVQHLDEARIAWLCPNLSAAKRRQLVERTELRRRDGFLSQNAERVARAVRAYHRLAPRPSATLGQVLADLQQRASTLNDLELSRPSSRPHGSTNVNGGAGGGAELGCASGGKAGVVDKVHATDDVEALEQPWVIEAAPEASAGQPHSALEIRATEGGELAGEHDQSAGGGVETAPEMEVGESPVSEDLHSQQQAWEAEAGSAAPRDVEEEGQDERAEVQDERAEVQEVHHADHDPMQDERDEKAVLLGEAREMLERLPSGEAVALLETLRDCSSPVGGMLRLSVSSIAGGEQENAEAERSRALLGTEQTEEGIQELMAAGRRLLELLAPQDRDAVVCMLAQGDTPLASHLLCRVVEHQASREDRPAAGDDAQQTVLEELLHDLLARGRELVDALGPEAFDAISSALAEGESALAASLRQVSTDSLTDKESISSPH